MELIIPGWARNETERRVIQVLAGVERIAYQFPDDPMMVKVGRCSWCGKCCMDRGNRHPFPTVNNNCVYLLPEAGGKYKCGLGVFRPYACCVSEPRKDKIPECTSIYEPQR